MSLTICTYNIHGGTDRDRKPSLPQIAETLRETDADVCLLQEVDRRLPRSGFVDQAQYLAKACGYPFVHFYGRLRLGGLGFGNAILSRQKPTEKLKLALPGGGEPRGAVGIRLANGAALWCTHLGLRDDWRTTQLTALAKAIRDEPLVLVAGDFNALPDAPEVTTFFSEANLTLIGPTTGTFPVPVPTHRIDLFGVRGFTWPGQGESIAGPGSDHCLVWVSVEATNRPAL